MLISQSVLETHRQFASPLTLPAMDDGVYSLTIDAIDDAGNALSTGPALTLTIDTTPPAPPASPDLRASSDTGISNSDDITKDNNPTFDFAPAPHVRIYSSIVLLADLIDAAGMFTTDTLADGSYSFTVREVDAAGNESDDSAPLVVHIDTVGPNSIQPVLISQSNTNDAGELVTNDDTPIIDLPGLYYFLNINGIQAGSGVESGPSEVAHLGDGLQHLTALTFDAAGNETSSSELLVRIDTVAPKIISADFLRDGGPLRVRIAFSEDVSRSLTSTDLVLHNLTTNQDITGATMTYDADANAAVWTFAGGTLPTGNYTANLAAQGVTDQAANPIDGDNDGSAGGDLNFSFFHFPGDVNLDRSVDFADLVTIAQQYGNNVSGWTQGDLNGDGVVGFGDLVAVAQNYGKTLDAPPTAPPAPAPRPVSAAPVQASAAQKPAAKAVKPEPIAKPSPHVKPPFGVARIR